MSELLTEPEIVAVAPVGNAPAEPCAIAAASRRGYPWARRGRMLIALATLQGLLAALGPADAARDEPARLALWILTFLCQSFLFHTGIAVLLVAAVALAARRPRLAALAVPALALSLLPEVADLGGGAGSAPGQVRLMSANLLYLNRDPAPLAGEIAAEDPDLLLLQEYTYAWDRSLGRVLAGRYPYVLARPSLGASGLALFSKTPLAPFELALPGPEWPAALAARVELAGRDVLVVNLHLAPPIPGFLGLKAEQQRSLAAVLAGMHGARIVAGDFNFTARAGTHRRLLEIGLVDAHQVTGSGRGTTWPGGLLGFLPGFRIDHVYLGGGLRPRSSRVGAGEGSDHRPLVVELDVAASGG